MRVYDLIRKKRDGGELTEEELHGLVAGYVAGEIPDYQMSAWLMAVYFRGMSPAETRTLTLAMAESGDQVDLSAIPGPKVDKHSTGGVGDTTSLVLAPLVAAVGVPVAKLSGRGLGHTGGTLDKLESFPGFRVDLTIDQMVERVRKYGLAIAAQTADLVPADKLMYSLRDVTATVDSIPLIAASIMSKKIAGGADAIVLDVKVGQGAFVQTLDDARQLAEMMVEIGRSLGRKTVAAITDMDQPLGHSVGNALEVAEAIETLRGRGPADLTELCLTLGVEMVCLAGAFADRETARRELEACLADGRALSKLRDLVVAQGGDARAVDDPTLLPRSAHRYSIVAAQAGYVQRVGALDMGQAAMLLGAGRAKKGDQINRSVGVEVLVKVGDQVVAGQEVVRLHYDNDAHLAEAEALAKRALQVAERPKTPLPLVRAIIR
ncbi:MAG: pyrimidine-nucleoside phosphorylase [Bacillota bacterium]